MQEAVHLAATVAETLHYAHRAGLVHRDVKPGNILLEDGIERVKISDFGLALVAMDIEELTSGDRPVGTPAYMSPEQVSGGRVVVETTAQVIGGPLNPACHWDTGGTGCIPPAP